MQRLWLGGLVAMVVSVPAFAGGQYVEEWNPPESHVGAPHKTAVKPPRHRRVSLTLVQPKRRHHQGTSAGSSRRVATGLNARNGQPSFEDLPRQITPEGNVLRVDGRSATARVQR